MAILNKSSIYFCFELKAAQQQISSVLMCFLLILECKHPLWPANYSDTRISLYLPASFCLLTIFAPFYGNLLALNCLLLISICSFYMYLCFFLSRACVCFHRLLTLGTPKQSIILLGGFCRIIGVKGLCAMT